jgi:UDP-glucuronate 4-epimerase
LERRALPVDAAWSDERWGAAGKSGANARQPRARSATASDRQRALVTGAAGFIGSRLVETLLSMGHDVVGLDSFSNYYEPRIKRANIAGSLGDPRFSMVTGDLATADLGRFLDGVDMVFHLAGQPGVRSSWGVGFADYVQHNVVATQRLLEALSSKPIPTVAASSSSVYGESDGSPLTEDAPLRPLSPYGMTKAAAEQLIDVYRRDRGVPVVSLRFFTVFGPRQRPDMAFQRFVEALERNQPLRIFGSGLQSRDFTYVDDVVAATISALGAPSPVYNVGGGTPASVNEAVALLQQLTGKQGQIVHEEIARGDVHQTRADTSRLREEVGWQPQTTLAEGLTAQIAAYRRQRDLADRDLQKLEH